MRRLFERMIDWMIARIAVWFHRSFIGYGQYRHRRIERLDQNDPTDTFPSK
jgi:hypothetical protein